MKKMRKGLAFLLAFVLTFAMCTGVYADEAAEPKILTAVEGDYSGKSVILHTNDMHGAVEGYAKVAALKAEFAAAGADVMLVDAGDFIQGTTYVSVSQGETAVSLMNAAGYDLVTLGNHEFDYGYENLKSIMEKAEFKITSNIMYQGELACEPGFVTETGSGLTLGIFGLTTPETATKAHPAKIQGVSFMAGQDLYDYTAEVVDILRDENACDVVICLSHLGVDSESAPNCSYDVLGKVKGIDFVIDGHSHTVMTAGDKGEAIQSTGTKAAYVGVVVLDDKGICDNFLFDLSGYKGSDETVKAMADSIIGDIEKVYGATFATTEALLNGERDPGVRTQETNLGDLITDAILWQATKDGGLAVPDENVVAVTNGGGIRATIPAGKITMNDINTVLPFGNTVAVIYVTGEALLEALEAASYCTPAAVGAFPQTAGIEYTVDTTIPYDQGELYPGSTYYAPKSIQRVSIQAINGKAFDKTATYAVVSNDFTAAGGDTYYAFTEAKDIMDTGIPMDEAVMSYIKEVLGGKITAADYGSGDGELTLILPFADVPASEWYYDEVEYVRDKGLMTGTSTTTFSPGENTSRGMLVTILYRLEGEPEVTKAAGFSDVAAGQWYTDAVAWAAENKIVEGYDGVFAPSDPITREQFATILYRYAKYKGYDVSVGEDTNILSYEDAFDVSEYAYPALQWACGEGLINGIDGSLVPQGSAIRAQAAAILMRFCENVVK